MTTCLDCTCSGLLKCGSTCTSGGTLCCQQVSCTWWRVGGGTRGRNTCSAAYSLSRYGGGRILYCYPHPTYPTLRASTASKCLVSANSSTYFPAKLCGLLCACFSGSTPASFACKFPAKLTGIHPANPYYSFPASSSCVAAAIAFSFALDARVVSPTMAVPSYLPTGEWHFYLADLLSALLPTSTSFPGAATPSYLSTPADVSCILATNPN